MKYSDDYVSSRPTLYASVANVSTETRRSVATRSRPAAASAAAHSSTTRSRARSAPSSAKKARPGMADPGRPHKGLQDHHPLQVLPEAADSAALQLGGQHARQGHPRRRPAVQEARDGGGPALHILGQMPTRPSTHRDNTA